MAQSNQIPAEVIQTAKRLPAVRESAKEIGFPLSARDIRPNPPIPAAQNAAAHYRRADTIYKRHDRDKALPDNWSDYPRSNRAEANRKAAQEALERSRELLKLADEAASLPHCDFNRPWDQGAETVLMPEFAVMRQFVRLLGVQATLRMDANNPMGAIVPLRTAATIARHVSEDPSLIALLVCIALVALIDGRLMELLQRYGNRNDVLQAAEALQKQLVGIIDLRRTFRGEAFFMLPSLEHHRQGKRDLSKIEQMEETESVRKTPTPFAAPNVRKVYADAWEVRYLEFWEQVLSRMAKPETTLRVLEKTMKTLASTHAAQMRSQPQKLSYLITAIVAPLFPGAVVQTLRTEATTRVRQAAITALKLRLNSGQFPSSLPNLPLDPFTDRPLIYRRTVSGFLLYSLGVNGTDEGGDAQRIGTGDYPYYPRDIVFRYPR